MSRSLAIASIVVGLLVGSGWAESRPRYGGTLRIETRMEWVNSSNPAREAVFETLTVVDDTGRALPNLATSWESQGDGRRWQLAIRRGVKFHDGTPLTATTVVDALTVDSCEECPWRAIRALGESVAFEFSEPHVNFAAELALPKYALALAGSRDIGTGPFKVTEQRSNLAMLGANDDYWKGRPFLDEIEVTTGRSERDQMMDMDVGRTDVIEAGVAQMRRVQQQRSRASSSRPVEVTALRIRTLRPELEDGRLREAIALSIDRATIHSGIFGGKGESTAALLPQWLTGYSFLFSAQRNVSRAQELVRALGQAPSVTIAADADPILQLVAERIALNLKDVGITARLAPSTDRADLVVRRTALTSSDAGTGLWEIAGGFNYDAQPTSDVPQKVYEQQRALADEHLIVPLVFMPRTWVVSQKVRNWMPTSTGGLRVEDVWVMEAAKP